MKKKINKTTWESLSPELQNLYQENSSGDYILELEDDDVPDTGPLKRALDREKELRKQYEKDLKELKKELESISEVDAKKRGDIALLEQSWNDKHSKLEKEYESKLSEANKFISENLMNSYSDSLASEISKEPKLMKRFIKDRLYVDFDDDGPKLKVKDQSGQPSSATLEELKKELLTDETYSAILVGTKASGAAQNTQTPRSVPGVNKNIDLSKLSPQEMKAYIDNKGT